MFWLGGGLLFWVGDHFFWWGLADAVARVLLDGFDDGEDAFFRFGHFGFRDGVVDYKGRSQYAILSGGGASHLVRRAFDSI